MRRVLPPLNALKAFEAAGRLGSFTRAAEELNVSHSAVSRHVRGLEKRLNVHLFRTRNTGVELTADGRRYLADITPVFDKIAEATELLTDTPKGTVTLTTESTIAQKWLIPLLPRLKKRHPEIELKLSVTTEVMDIDAHDFDIGLRFLRDGQPEAETYLFPSIVQAFAAPGFASMIDGKVDLGKLASGPLIEEATFKLWPEWFKKSGLTDIPELDLSYPVSALLAIQSAVSGLGAVLMDKRLCAAELTAGTLVPLSDIEIPYGCYFLAVNQRAGRRRAVKAVRDWLVEVSKS